MFKNPKTLIGLLSGILLALLVALLAVMPRGAPVTVTPSPSPTERVLPEGRKGIDVCSHQGIIDWEAVAASGIEFAIIRVGYRGYSEGGLYADENFESNFAGAKAAGLDVGVYFFSQALDEGEAEAEADFVLQTLGARALELPVCFDWEPVAGGRTGADDPKLTARADAFCKKIAQSGYAPCVYFNLRQWFLSYDLGALDYCERWVAAYDFDPDTEELDMMQYSEHGTVPGIDVEVDLNLRFGAAGG